MTASRPSDGGQSPDTGSAVIGRGFRCSLITFVMIAILVVLGLYLMSKRSTDFSKGEKLGVRDHLTVLTKPKKKPDWMSQDESS